jgi:hypothetical protein
VSVAVYVFILFLMSAFVFLLPPPGRGDSNKGKRENAWMNAGQNKIKMTQGKGEGCLAFAPAW